MKISERWQSELNGTSLQWDERYRLKEVQIANGTNLAKSVSYEYDVLGRRVSRLEDGVTNFYVYDGNQVVADLDGNGDILRSYVWGQGIDNLLSMTVYTNGGSQASATYYAIKDHQNTVLALADASGAVVESYEYDAYGNTTIIDASGLECSESAIGNRYMFQGREYDSATGLYYFRARWYDSGSGRWLSKDPIGISGGLNLYAFCENDPINNIDPSGLWTLQIGISANGGVLGRGGVSGGVAISYSKEDGWDFGGYTSESIGAQGGITGSVGVEIGWSGNGNIGDLEGGSTAGGGSGGLLGVIGVDAIHNDGAVGGGSLTIGFGGSAEAHIDRVITQIYGENECGDKK